MTPSLTLVFKLPPSYYNHCQILGQPGFQGFYTILEDKKKVIFQFPSNSCNILLKRSFWMIFYVLESSDSVFFSFPTFVLC